MTGVRSEDVAIPAVVCVFPRMAEEYLHQLCRSRAPPKTESVSLSGEAQKSLLINKFEIICVQFGKEG